MPSGRPVSPDFKVSYSGRGVAFSPDGRFFAAEPDYYAGEPVFWDIHNRRPVTWNADGKWSKFAFSPDGHMVAIGTGKGVRLRSLPA
jgi:hypothetical protein